jgi:hypothetical protein
MVTPATPSKLTSSSSYNAIPMGVMAITKSGAPIYNPLSQLNGSLASYYIRVHHFGSLLWTH